MIEVDKTIAVDVDGRELEYHGTDLFPIKIYELAVPEYSIPWHWHEDWEYILCTRNRVRCETAEGSIVLDPGYGVFLGPRVLHEVAAEDEWCGLRSVVFHPRFISGENSLIWQKYVRPVENAGAVKLSPDIPWQWECMHDFCTCWHAMDQEEPGYEIKARQALEDAVYRLSCQPEICGAGMSEKAQRDTRRIKRMMQFIQQNFREELTVAQIAASASISDSECLRCFRNNLRTTPSRYLREFRLQKAEEMLASTKEKTGDVGAACGFNDSAYFTKIFREAKGVTPMEYRRVHERENG